MKELKKLKAQEEEEKHLNIKSINDFLLVLDFSFFKTLSPEVMSQFDFFDKLLKKFLTIHEVCFRFSSVF